MTSGGVAQSYVAQGTYPLMSAILSPFATMHWSVQILIGSNSRSNELLIRPTIVSPRAVRQESKLQCLDAKHPCRIAHGRWAYPDKKPPWWRDRLQFGVGRIRSGWTPCSSLSARSPSVSFRIGHRCFLANLLRDRRYINRRGQVSLTNGNVFTRRWHLMTASPVLGHFVPSALRIAS